MIQSWVVLIYLSLTMDKADKDKKIKYIIQGGKIYFFFKASWKQSI